MSKEQETVVLTEEDLAKSLQALAAEKPEEKPAPEPKAVIEDLKKTLIDAVKEAGTPELKKALETNEALGEFGAIVGHHVDNALQQMHKSIANAAQRDLLFIKSFERMTAELGELRKTVEKYGEQPGTPAAAGAGTEKPLEKKVGEGETGKDPKVDVQLVRKNVINGLTKLAMGATPGSPEMQKWTGALALFESTNRIDDETAKAALQAAAKAA